MDAPVYKTRGVILKKADFSDTDRLLTVYTEKFGKILVRAKGVGKKESKLKSLIEPFNVYEFLLAKSKNIDVLANSYPIKEFLYLRGHLEDLSLAIYFVELVDKLVVEPERDEKIWGLLVRAFNFLDEEADKAIKAKPHASARGAESGAVSRSEIGARAAFEEKLLEFLGHPAFAVRGKKSVHEKQNYLESLAGEEIKSDKFLRSQSFIN
jgi:hypothetical protein